MTDGDTIAAIATASGPAGVGIVRVSGPRAVEICEAALGGGVRLTREVRVGWVRDVRGQRIDQVIAFAMRGQRSFTGEDVAELQGHGGAINLAQLLAAVVGRGARVAEPGEFTRRAVEHGKLDLTRAEALLGVIGAGSERAWRVAQANLGGQLGEVVRALEVRGIAVLAEIEGRIDFPEDDLGDDAPAKAWVQGELEAIAAACAKLVGSFATGRRVETGIVVALVGAVNVGKSSLLNALVGKERALVAETPGTTRDYVEARCEWDGVAVTLVDTAGRRSGGDAVEVRGIELGAARAASADVVVIVDDGSGQGGDLAAEAGARGVRVASKCDRRTEAASEGELQTSAVTGVGLAALRRRVLELAGVAGREGDESAWVTTARQVDVIGRASVAFAAAERALAIAAAAEVVAIEVRTGVSALAQLRGLDVGERVRDELFARFCIGK